MQLSRVRLPDVFECRDNLNLEGLEYRSLELSGRSSLRLVGPDRTSHVSSHHEKSLQCRTIEASLPQISKELPHHVPHSQVQILLARRILTIFHQTSNKYSAGFHEVDEPKLLERWLQKSSEEPECYMRLLMSSALASALALVATRQHSLIMKAPEQGVAKGGVQIRRQRVDWNRIIQCTRFDVG